MEDRKNKTEEELKNRLKHIDEDRDTLARRTREIWQEEEEEDQRLRKEYQDSEYMREACTPGDADILQLLDEKQAILNTMRIQKSEFKENYQEEIRKQNLRMDMDEEDISLQISSLQKQEDK